MILAIDIETGGQSSAQNPLLQIGLYNPETKAPTSIYIKPTEGLIITPQAAAVNGWPESHKGKEVLSEQDGITRFVRLLEALKPDYLLAHNAPFDYTFLREVAARNGLGLRPRCLCTMTTAYVLRDMGGLPVKNINLDSLLAELAPDFKRSKTHDAGEDAEACWVVWEAMRARLQTMSDLACKSVLAPQPTQQRPQPRRNSWGGR
jgi:DNA polymerase III epsilon subunit-like protein